MALFRAYLLLVFVVLLGYTLVVGMEHGWNLLPVFFSGIAEMTWSGQFSLDFTTFLGLSAIWVAWRHRFSPGGLALAVVVFFGGMMSLAPYLLRAAARAEGDVEALLLGPQRTAG